VENLNKPLTAKKIKEFNKDFVENHKKEFPEHEIFEIPAGFTVLDAISYVFDNDIRSISDFMSKYFKQEVCTIDLLRMLEEGIDNRILCLNCVRDTIRKTYNKKVFYI